MGFPGESDGSVGFLDQLGGESDVMRSNSSLCDKVQLDPFG